MFLIKCDGETIYDPRMENLNVNEPKCKLEANTVGEASFLIYSTHPYYEKLQKMRSIFEIIETGFYGDEVIFRGRMTNDSRDFYNAKLVDVEGVMAFFNDSVIRPFSFPKDFAEDQEYITASKSGNVIEFFLKWVIDQHNSQVQEFQRFKLGTVTVKDSNNYLYRSTEEILSSWEVLKTRLFESSIGGYLCIRYEDDGNYIDFLDDFETSEQTVEFGENLIDVLTESDASQIYTAIIPFGKKKSEISPEDSKDHTDNSRVSIAEISDELIPSNGLYDETADIVKIGDMMYSKNGIEKYGFICAPVADTTWDDVTDPTNLFQKAYSFLSGSRWNVSDTITVKAINSDKDPFTGETYFQLFKIYRYINIISKPHRINDSYKLTKIEIDLQNPQNTIITLGNSKRGMTDISASNKKASSESISNISKSVDTSNLGLQKQINVAIEEIAALDQTINNIANSLSNEWTALNLDETFAPHNGLEENLPMYKTAGNVVEVKGCVSPVAGLAPSTEKIVFAGGIPEALRPSSVRSFICQGSGMNRWLLTVETDGSLTISKYGASECVAVPTTEELLFNGTYTISQRKDDENVEE